LEKRVLQFEMAVEILLSRHGKEVSTKQMDLRRVADVAIDLFAMAAVLSRSSRAYCIGLQNAEHEVIILPIISINVNNFVIVFSTA
jgi:hypothetical protein